LPGWQGRFEVRAATEGGTLPDTLRSLTAREREGGESFRLAPGGRARSLKKQFQARGLAAWDRDGPLLYTAAGDLLFVPGLGIEAGHLAAAGERQLTLSWVADDGPATGPRQPGG
jgi:tRNA(Ile)-lysidine synthase